MPYREEDYANTSIVIGRRYRFDYPIEFTTLPPEYSYHRGMICVVDSPDPEADVLWDDLEGTKCIVDRMFKVHFDDGWVGSAWESELIEL